MTHQSEYQRIAHEWRQRQPSERASTGVVLIWNQRVTGWKNSLRHAAHERPGVVAVDVDGHVHIATGGDDEDGAKCWVVF